MVGKRRLTEVRHEETVERDVTMNPLGQGQRILGKKSESYGFSNSYNFRYIISSGITIYK